MIKWIKNGPGYLTFFRAVFNLFCSDATVRANLEALAFSLFFLFMSEICLRNDFALFCNPDKLLPVFLLRAMIKKLISDSIKK